MANEQPQEDRQGLDDKYRSIIEGKLSGAELVIGMVGAVGADLARVARYITEEAEAYQYKFQGQTTKLYPSGIQERS